MDDGDEVVRSTSGLVVEHFDGELVILDPATGGLHHLDHHAALVWAHIDGSSDAAGIASHLASELGLERSAVDHGVDVALQQFRDIGLLSKPDA